MATKNTAKWSKAKVIAAIPTTYRGIRFRSRLEAKWAAMFDQVKWQWSYEPFDFDGYIPDFAIMGGRVLVEVKPALDLMSLCNAIDKVEDSGCQMPVWIVGAEPAIAVSTNEVNRDLDLIGYGLSYMRIPRDHLHGLLGVWCNRPGMQDGYWWCACFLSACEKCGKWTPLGRKRRNGSEDGERVTFSCTKNPRGEFIVRPEQIRNLWAKCCNETQWRAR